MVEVEIPFEDKVIRLRVDVVSVASKTPTVTPPAKPTVTLKPRL